MRLVKLFAFKKGLILKQRVVFCVSIGRDQQAAFRDGRDGDHVAGMSATLPRDEQRLQQPQAASHHHKAAAGKYLIVVYGMNLKSCRRAKN